ncbi:BNR-4 repeat-containing protein, partial [bacterium]|nr:BNR-4 repeat-containing protein [bacterium]
MSSLELEQACRHRRDVPRRRAVSCVALQVAEIVIIIAVATVAGCGRSGARNVGEPTSVAPGSSFAAVTPNGAWCWFADPRAVTVEGKHRRTYTGWVDTQGAVSVASIDHESGDVRATAFEGFREQDDHANPAVMVRPDRHLLVFYSAHGGDEMLYRVSLKPEDVTSWSEPRVVPLDEEPAGYGLTYPNPIALSGEDDRIFLFYRGRDRRPRFVFTLEGGGWSDEHQLVRTERGDSYAKYASDGEKTIHIAFTYGHPQGRPSNSLYYARYMDGRFERAD